MSLHRDLLEQAKHLVGRERTRPRQASLRRAVSSAYYSLFHLFVNEATALLLRGSRRVALRHCLGRAFAHAEMKKVAQTFANDRVSPKLLPGLGGHSLQDDLRRVAAAFVNLQQARHEADYDTARRFTRRETRVIIRQAEQAFRMWRGIRGTLQADTFLVGLLAQERMRV